MKFDRISGNSGRVAGKIRRVGVRAGRAGALLLLLMLISWMNAQAAGLRIKDIAHVGSASETPIQGFGLVTGLAGDGDKNPVYTIQPIANMLQKLGITISPTAIQAKNVAAVMVTAELPAFAKPGGRLDIHVSSMGDAKSLVGGVLLQTPLFAANGKMFAVAQGPLVVGGFSLGQAGAGGASVSKNHPTVATIADGAKVIAELPNEVLEEGYLELLLREADYTSVSRLAETVNKAFPGTCEAVDSSSAKIKVPATYLGRIVDFVSKVEALEVMPDSTARVVINERTGTIVANSLIRISPCAISHGNLTIQISSTLDVSQPNALSQTGTTTVTEKTDAKVNETKGAMIPLPEMPTVEKVAASLNALGVTPRDMITIFTHMKKVGALQAELRVN